MKKVQKPRKLKLKPPAEPTKLHRALSIWLIEDNSDVRRVYREILEDSFSGLKISGFGSSMEALKEDRATPHIILVDVAGLTGGVLPGMGTDFMCFVRLFERLVEKHRSASFGMYSMVDTWAEDLVEELRKLVPDAHVEFIKDLDLEATGVITKSDGMIDFVKKYKGDR